MRDEEMIVFQSRNLNLEPIKIYKQGQYEKISLIQTELNKTM
jgi:hypothetical protein